MNNLPEAQQTQDIESVLLEISQVTDPIPVVPPAMFCLFNAVPDDNFARTQLPILLVRK